MLSSWFPRPQRPPAVWPWTVSAAARRRTADQGTPASALRSHSRCRSSHPTTAVRWWSSPSAPAFCSSAPCRSPSPSPPASEPRQKSSASASSVSACCWCCPAYVGASGCVYRRSANGTGRHRRPAKPRLVTTRPARWSQWTTTTTTRTGKHLSE